ncbi:hypothetical protein GCM10025857_39820 [Alicyclobacillus contaminans]|nr:hypothetical protein GCM10025857_00290 [Alicyclobacillus contaminans]GMA52625.1 hypothetical protein GCM10025857_39820 [Alicyclobacillus contaminans]
MTPQQFIATVAPAAVAFYRAHKISAALTIAQAALESEWGTAAPGNNLFGIKADVRIEPHIVKTDGMAFKKEMIDLQFR